MAALNVQPNKRSNTKDLFPPAPLYLSPSHDKIITTPNTARTSDLPHTMRLERRRFSKRTLAAPMTKDNQEHHAQRLQHILRKLSTANTQSPNVSKPKSKLSVARTAIFPWITSVLHHLRTIHRHQKNLDLQVHHHRPTRPQAIPPTTMKSLSLLHASYPAPTLHFWEKKTLAILIFNIWTFAESWPKQATN